MSMDRGCECSSVARKLKFWFKFSRFEKSVENATIAFFIFNENSSIWDIKLWCFRKIRFWSLWEQISRIFEPISKFALENFWSKSTFQCHSFLSNCLSFPNFEKFRETNQKIPIFRKKWKKLRFFSLFIFLGF